VPESTPEQLGREAGEAIANAIADNLEAVIMRLADGIAKVQAEQAELRDALNDVAKDVASLLVRTRNLERKHR
jgi:hypothetical protein